MSIAQAHFGAWQVIRRSELELERLLDHLYDGAWSHFETDSAERSIEIFGVTPSDSAIARLLEEGFASVREHPHGFEKFVYCDCRTVGHAPRRWLTG